MANGEIFGMVRWYVVEDEQWQVQQALFDKLNELGLRAKPWSSRTAVIWFGKSQNDATVSMRKLRKWLGDQKRLAATEGRTFNFVLCAAMQGAFAIQ